ncbi:MAG: type IV pilus assembly protein PilM [bacterium]|nr:type IV pilus assembly protein PilM [bacterium]
MVFNPLKMLLPKKFLGIDIGTSFIKMVEVSRFGYRRKLENYGSLPASVLYQKPFRTFEKNTLILSSEDIARAIRAVMQQAKIETRQVVFSIPDFSSFFTTIELPSMSEEELPQAVRYEARQHIPLPLGETTLDWQLLDERQIEQQKRLKVLLVAVPNEIINQYREIARLANLELYALEAEVFGLIRALAKEDDKDPLALIDIGAQSTTCNIVEKKNLKVSYSFDMSANDLTDTVSKSLGVTYLEAEELKKSQGLKMSEGNESKGVREILLPLVDVILREVETVFNNFYQKGGREIQKIILAGGVALLPGLKEYFRGRFRKEVEIANPFVDLFYPPILENTLREMGPAYAIAVGVALRGLEY